jgi:hypothetical protein
MFLLAPFMALLQIAQYFLENALFFLDFYYSCNPSFLGQALLHYFNVVILYSRK